MHKCASRFNGLVVGITFVLAACGGDPTGTNSGDPLTNTEALAIFEALGATFGSISVGGAPPQPGSTTGAAPAAAGPIDESFEISVPCESGTIQMSGSMSGTVDEQTLATNLTMDITWVPNACAITTGTTTFTISGDPEIRFQGDWALADNLFSLSGTETGGFSFTSSDGRVGSCAIDIAFSSSVNLSTTTEESTISGTICGLPASGFQAQHVS